MPHRPVIKNSSGTTRVRPVFNASFAGFDNYSLNDALLTGPSMNPEIPEILIGFRTHKIALSADVTKAFLQISVKPEDRDSLRFLLDGENGIRHMRFCRMPFGVTSSPYLLSKSFEPIIDIEKYSSLLKVLNITAYALRFLSNKICDVNNKLTGPLSQDEIKKPMKKLIISVQRCKYQDEYLRLVSGRSISKNSTIFNLDPYLDDEGVMRVKGRLEKSNLNFESKHPIILPKGHFAKLLISHQHKLMKHAGCETLYANLREEYWNKNNIEKGDIVMIKNENTPRLTWPLGLVTEVYPGSDGLVRSVSVKTS